MGYLLGKNNLRDQRPHFNVITIVIRTKKKKKMVLVSYTPCFLKFVVYQNIYNDNIELK